MMGEELSMEDLKRIMVDPFYAINVHEGMCAKHEPMITKEQWIKVAIINITQDDDGNNYEYDDELLQSLNEWLTRLLDVLEGNYAK